VDLDRRAVGLGDLSIGAEIDASFQCAVRTRSTKQAIAMNEAETRAEHIDPALAAAGWGVVDESRIRREYPITLGRIEGRGRRGKALKADYVLEYRNTKLATVEAKAWDQELTEGVGQAVVNVQTVEAIDSEFKRRAVGGN
jgi:type I site-specific restriction endonuclease